ncbi:MAG TPA: lysylphosphatidylglycerol synthase transmembrane domain-containing protein [Candidatus Saccharimonadales bacterium]
MSKTANRKHYIIGLCIVLLAAIGLFGIVPQLGDFESSLAMLRDADPLLVGLAVAASIGGTLCSAFVYKTLSVKRLFFVDTALVQLSGLLVNRVLPAGVGGLGLNYLYLRARKHTVAQATTIVSLNNIIGLTGHLLLAVCLLLIAPTLFDDMSLPVTALAFGGAAMVVLMTTILLVWHQRSVKLRAWKRALRFYVQQPARLMRAIIISCFLTLSNVLSLWLCCQALDVSLNFFVVFVVFTFGIVVGTVTPTPGGLGGTEAALVAAFMTQDVSAALALAVALLYRLVSYWFGLLIGTVAVSMVYRRHLLAA